MNCCFCHAELTEKDAIGPLPPKVLCKECRDFHISEMDSDNPSKKFLAIQRAIDRYHKGENINGVPSNKSISAERWRVNHPLEITVNELCKKYPHLVQVLYECACDNLRKHNHHFDYSRPFEVIRLCNSCHRKEHARLRRLSCDLSQQSF